MTPAQQEERKKVIAKIFLSKDPDQVSRGADALERAGMVRIAGRARHYAKLLRKASEANVPLVTSAAQAGKAA